MCGTSVRQIFADPDYSFHHHLVGLNIMVSIILLLLRGPSPQSESPFPDPESTTTAHSLPPFTLAGHHCYLPTPPYPPLCPRSTSCIVVHLRCCCRRRVRVCEQRRVVTHSHTPSFLLLPSNSQFQKNRLEST